MKKLIPLLLLMNTAFADQCFDSGNVKTIPFFNAGMGYGGTNGLSAKKTKLIYYNGNENKIDYYDLKSDSLKSIPLTPNSYPTWIDDDHVVVTEMPPESLNEDYRKRLEEDPKLNLEFLKKFNSTVYNLKTGEKIVKKGVLFEEGSLDELMPVKAEKKDGGNVLTFRTKSGKIVKQSSESKKDSVYKDWRGQTEVTISPKGVLRIYNREELQFQDSIPAELIHGPPAAGEYNSYSSGTINPAYKVSPEFHNKMLIIQAVNDKSKQTHKHIIIDLKNKKQKILDLGGRSPDLNAGNEAVSKNGSAIVVFPKPTERGAFYLDLKKDEVVKLSEENIEQPVFNDQNQLCGINRIIIYENKPAITNRTMGFINFTTYQNNISISPMSPPLTYDCFDITTKKKISSKYITDKVTAQVQRINDDKFIVNDNQMGLYPGLMMSGGMGMYSGSANTSSQLVTSKTVCAKKLILEDCDCENINSPKIDFKNLNQLSLKLACESNYNKDLWSALIKKPASKITEKEALIWLTKFSKPGGLATDELDVFVALVDAKAYVKYPAEFKASLSSLYFTSPILYKSILLKYPQLTELKGKDFSNCLTSEEKSKIKAAKRALFQDKLANLQSPTEEALEPILKQAKELLNEEEMDTLAEDIADLAVAKMSTQPELEGIFPSKVYKFVYNKVKGQLGLPNKDITDVTVVRANNEIKLKLMGVSPVANANKSLAGIYVSTAKTMYEPSIPLGQIQEKMEWSHLGKKYSAVIDFKREIPKEDLTPANPAPNYAEMKKENFRGLIVVGSNMGPSSTENVVQEYLEYFNEEGFEFEEAEEIKDTRSFIQSRVAGENKAHYFVKEAHSDGDEKNLFRISNSGKVLRGVRTLENGKKEYVDIVYPGKDYKTSLLSNNDFGEWMQQREKAGGSELVYLNSSCWSSTKATFEIAAAKTPKLVNIPTTTLMTTFTNREGNVMHSAIDGLRKEQTYAEIRERMKMDPMYEKRTENVMIFPDEPAYEEKIRKNAKVPLAIDTKVYVERNNIKEAYSIEDAH